MLSHDKTLSECTHTTLPLSYFPLPPTSLRVSVHQFPFLALLHYTVFDSLVLASIYFLPLASFFFLLPSPTLLCSHPVPFVPSRSFLSIRYSFLSFNLFITYMCTLSTCLVHVSFLLSDTNSADLFHSLFTYYFVIFSLSSAPLLLMYFNVVSLSFSPFFSFYPHPAAHTIKPFPRAEAKDCKGCRHVNESILKRGSRFLFRSLLLLPFHESASNTSNTPRKESNTYEILLGTAAPIPRIRQFIKIPTEQRPRSEPISLRYLWYTQEGGYSSSVTSRVKIVFAGYVVS